MGCEELPFVYLKGCQNTLHSASSGSVALSPSGVAEVQADLDHLKTIAQHPRWQNLLASERTSIEFQVTQHQRAAVLRKQSEEAQLRRQNCSEIKIVSYAWDQSALFTSVYVSFDAVAALPEGSVVTEFGPCSFSLSISTPKGQTHILRVPNLCHNINVEKSKNILKQDRLVIKLKKTEKGQDWASLDDSERKKKELREE